MNTSIARKISITALLSTIALIAFVLENLFPPLFLPGARLGLSNVFILLVAIFIGGKYAIFALTIKCILGSIFAGNFFSVVYSLPSGLITLAVELLLIYRARGISIIATSISGAVLNTTLQNVTFCIATATTEYLVYLPYLAIIGIFSGLCVGLIVYLIAHRVSFKKEKNTFSGTTPDK